MIKHKISRRRPQVKPAKMLTTFFTGHLNRHDNPRRYRFAAGDARQEHVVFQLVVEQTRHVC